MNKLAIAVSIAIASSGPAGCTPQAGSEPPPEPPASVSVMAFNVENLFDTEDAPGKDDKTFLPLSKKQDAAHIDACNEIEVERWRRQCLEWDWNDAVLEVKLERVADAILQVDDGRGPDIVALQEIENIEVLERLRSDYLGDAGYRPAILIEGQDQRGIDVAFLTRLPLATEPTLHPLEFDDTVPTRWAVDTRGVLQADFELPDGEILTGFSVHFPAPFQPTYMREHAYRHLEALRDALPADRPVFAAGDFNTTSREDAEQQMLERFVRDRWTVAHEVGCDACPGTSYYAPRDDWSFLDMVLWSGGSGWSLNPESVSIPNDAPQQTRAIDAGLAPNRFDIADQSGISDHFPILVRIEN